MKMLTRQEELILLTVFRQGGASSLVKIRQYLNEKTAKEWSVSSIYVPLDRLARAGHLDTEIGEPEARRGGKAVKTYRLTREGLKALNQLKSIHDVMWDGIQNVIME